MSSHTTSGWICLKDDLGIEYVICKVEYTLWESEEFEYRFEPIYPVIDLLDTKLFQGIPGINLDKRESEYVRKNMIPTFISERSPSSNREELWKLLEDCNMQYLNSLEWLIKTDTHYVGDRLYVTRNVLRKEGPVSFDKLKRNVDIQKRLLDYICAGKSFSYEGFEIDDSNRTICYNLLYRLYGQEAERIKKSQMEGIKKAKAEGKYQGRKSIQIDDLAFRDIVRKYENKQISAVDAANKFKISVRTFYRRIKEIEE